MMVKRSSSRAARSPSLVSTILVGTLLPVGMALLPLFATGVSGQQPFAWMMFWASPDVLPFLALLGGGAGAVTYWLRSGGDSRRRPSVVLRVGSALATFSLVPIPLMVNRASLTAGAFMFLAPNLVMAGVALAWRVARWSGVGRVAAISIIAAIDTFWIVGMLAHAPDRHAGLRAAALPAAIVLFGMGLFLGRRDAPVAD